MAGTVASQCLEVLTNNKLKSEVAFLCPDRVWLKADLEPGGENVYLVGFFFFFSFLF